MAGGVKPGRQKLNTDGEVSGDWLSEVLALVEVMQAVAGLRRGAEGAGPVGEADHRLAQLAE